MTTHAAPNLATTVAESMGDALLAYGFQFRGISYTVVIRRDARLGREPDLEVRVDVWEGGGDLCGVCYLDEDDGPLADMAEWTPLCPQMIHLDENGAGPEWDAWCVALMRGWEVVRPAYLALAAQMD
jgi:hypothetical protein